MILKKKWSPDASLSRLKLEKPELCIIKSVSTLYQYIYRGLIKTVDSGDLWRKGRLYYSKRPDKRERMALKSIEERPLHILTRQAFGHWEMDTVISKRGDKTCLLVLTERKTRFELVFKMTSKHVDDVKRVLDQIEKQIGFDRFKLIFKTITTDNGTEFLDYPKIEMGITGELRTQVYFCHTNSPEERGSNENANTIIRRFIKKGAVISSVSNEKVKQVQTYMNTLPRKILGYQTALEAFQAEFL